MGRKDTLGVWDQHVHTALFKMDNQQGPTVKKIKNKKNEENEIGRYHVLQHFKIRYD